MYRHKLGITLLVTTMYLALMQIGCGGGVAPLVPASAIKIKVSPYAAVVPYGKSQQFTATVTGTPNTAVTWTADQGKISASGLFTAPQRFAWPNTATVTAVSGADSTITGSTKITLGRSAPAGSWQLTGPDGGGIIYSLTQDTSHTGIIFAGTAAGLFKSLDGGLSWKPQITNSGLDTDPAYDIAIENSGSTIYACAGWIFVRSSDGGKTWTNYPLSHTPARSMGVDPFHTSTIYLSVPGSGVLKSTDGGKTWSLLAGSPIIANDSVNDRLHPPLVADPVNQNVVYFGTEHGLFISKNGGASWTQSTNGLWALDVAVRDVTFASGGHSVLLLAGDPSTATSDLYLSTDAGNSWVEIATGVDGERVAPDPYDASVIYLHGLQLSEAYKSTDGGHTFTSAANGLPPAPGPGPALFNGPTGTVLPVIGLPHKVLISVVYQGLFGTSDSASTWGPATKGLSAWFGVDVDVDPSSPTTVYLVAWFRGIFKSNDGGLTWANINPGNAYAIAVDPFDSQHLLMVGTNIQPFETHDGGTTWQAVALPIPPGTCAVRSITFNPVLKGNIFLSCLDNSGYGVLQSHDGGISYSVTNAGLGGTTNAVERVFVNPLDPTIVFASTNLGMYKSVDGGNSWTQKSSMSGGQISMDVRNKPPILYASRGLVSTDNGETWYGVFCNGFLIADPSTAGSAFSADSWSPDAGMHWFPVLPGLGASTGGSLGRIVVAQSSPQVLLFADTFHSIFRFVVGP